MLKSRFRLNRKFLRNLTRAFILLIVCFYGWLIYRTFEFNPVRFLRKLQASDIPSSDLKIPKIIHQSWKTRELPEELATWRPTWKQFNPDFGYILWDDEMNRVLIRDHYPWFLSKYDSFKKPILKADAARLFYLHKYGGIYADLDVTCLKPLEPLIRGRELLLGNMNTEPKPFLIKQHGETNYMHSLPNAFMASKPQHPFWIFCAVRIMNLKSDEKLTVEETTGPVMIWKSLSDYVLRGLHLQDSVYIAPPEHVFPYSWCWPSTEFEKSICSHQRDTFNETKCIEIIDPGKKAYTISFWAHSWEDINLKTRNA